MFWMRNL